MGKTFKEVIEKFNPYHDRLGRFTTAEGAVSFTYSPGKSKAHDLAIAREKERRSNPGSKYGLSKEQHKKLQELCNTSLFRASRYRREIGMDEEAYQKYKSEFSSDEKRHQARIERERKKADAQKTAAKELEERVKNELPGLSQESIHRSNENSLFGSSGSVKAKEALQRLDKFKEDFKDNPDWTEEQRTYVKQRTQEYASLITEYYNDQIKRNADNISWAVAGPANYNRQAHEKKLNAQMNSANQYEQKLQNFRENTQKRLKNMEPEDKQIEYWRSGKWKHGETIDAADPLAERKLSAKLEYHQEMQQKMKEANAYHRKNGSMQGYKGFSEATNQRIDRQMQEYKDKGLNYLTGKPFQTASLTNNNAQLKSTQKRLKQVQANKEEAAASGGSGATRSFNGGSVVRNATANRLQIKFDSIPDAETRQKLKSNGWRWSPKNKVWQRQLTNNAERSAQSLLDGLEKSFPKRALYIGLNVSDGEALALDGGEDPKDYHVTLMYGYHDRLSGDSDDLSMRVQSSIEAIRSYIPDEIELDKIDAFEPFESSDGKKVIDARVKKGQLEDLHNQLKNELLKNGIRVQESFKEYQPHITLAYIEPDKDFESTPIEHIVKAKNITIGIEDEEGDTKANAYTIKKTDEDKRLVFGWANVATRANGEVIQDWQGDIVEPEDLEESAYKYVLDFRDGGEEHIRGLRKKCRMVESVVFTEEKLKAMGIPLGIVPLGWWIGFYVDDDEAWEKIKNGTYTQFSIEGSGQRHPVKDIDTRMKKSIDSKGVAKTFSEVEKFNPYHDRLGRFTTAEGAVSFTYSPGKSKAHDLAIAREQKKYTNVKPNHKSDATGKSYEMTKLESKEAEQDRETALKHLEHYFSLHPNRNQKKIDKQMKVYLDETDATEWKSRAHTSPFGVLRNFTSAKTKAQKEKEATAKKDRDSKKRAKERAASKMTEANRKYHDYEQSLRDKYGKENMFDTTSWYRKATEAERQKLTELDEARVFRNKRGQWQVAKTFLQFMKSA